MEPLKPVPFGPTDQPQPLDEPGELFNPKPVPEGPAK